MASKLVAALARFFPDIMVGGEPEPMLFQTLADRSKEAEQVATPYCVYQIRSVGYFRTFKASKIDSLTMQVSILVPASAYADHDAAMVAVNAMRSSVVESLFRRLNVTNLQIQEGYSIENNLLSADISVTYKGDTLRSFSGGIRILPVPETPLTPEVTPMYDIRYGLASATDAPQNPGESATIESGDTVTWPVITAGHRRIWIERPALTSFGYSSPGANGGAAWMTYGDEQSPANPLRIYMQNDFPVGITPKLAVHVSSLFAYKMEALDINDVVQYESEGETRRPYLSGNESPYPRIDRDQAVVDVVAKLAMIVPDDLIVFWGRIGNVLHALSEDTSFGEAGKRRYIFTLPAPYRGGIYMFTFNRSEYII